MVDRAHKIDEQHNLTWLPKGAVFELYVSRDEPPREITPTVFAFCFKSSSLLMTHHRLRGWELPGGHVEHTESLVEGVKRELLEEACVEISSLVPFAHALITIPPGVSNGKYPSPQSYMGFYLASIVTEKTFHAVHETIAREFFSPEQAMSLPWIQKNLALYEVALKMVK